MPRILVVEDDPVDQQRIARALRDAGFQPEVATTGAQAIDAAMGTTFAAITLDLILPDRSGLEVLASIRATGPNRNVPVLVVTIVAEPALTTGFAVSDILPKPLEHGALVSALERAGITAHTRARVLVIDDDPQAQQLMVESLARIGLDPHGETDPLRALQRLNTLRPDAIILDLAIPGLDGFQVLDALRSAPAWRHVPVFVWTSLSLQEGDLARLTESARSIVRKGHGGVERLLEEVRRAMATRWQLARQL